MAQFGNVQERVAFVGATLQLGIWSVFETQASIMRRAYKVTAVGGAGLTFGQILTHFAGLVHTPFKPLISSLASYRGLELRGIRGEALGAAAPAFDDTNAGAGTGGATILPGQVSGLIKLLTNSSGRHGHGRVYVPWPATTDVGIAENPNAGYVTRLNALGTFLRAIQTVTVGADSLTLTPVILNRESGASIVIVNTISLAVWATQRRRGDFGPTNPSPV